MLVLVYGKDSYRVQDKINQIVSTFKGASIFIDNKNDLIKIEEQLLQNSIFQEKNLFIINNLWFLIKENKKLVSLIDKSKETTLVFKEEKIDKKSQEFFNKKGKVFNFENLKRQEISSWIKQRIKDLGGDIEIEALFLLTEYVKDDLWLAANEIDKLLSYKKGTIRKQDVILLVYPKIEGDIFKALDFLASKNPKQALEIFYKHIKKGDHVLYLLTMISFQFRNLIIVKTNKKNTSNELDMHPFVFQKSLKLANSFSEQDLKRIYQKILQTEINIKTGKLMPEVAFDFLIIDINN